MQKLSVGTPPSYATNEPELAVELPPETIDTYSTSAEQKEPEGMKRKSAPMLTYVVMGVAIGAGVFTGLGAARLSAKSGSNPLVGDAQPIAQIAGDNVKAGDVFGSADAETFSDAAQGYLEIGGNNGDGTHKLLREGGPSQTVYLTSSVTDLDKFDGMDVTISGETFKSQSAGWLMDVGRVEIVNTQGTSPAEE